VLDQEPGPEERAFQKEHRRIVDSALEAFPPSSVKRSHWRFSRT
jgi:hypothetical protein